MIEEIMAEAGIPYREGFYPRLPDDATCAVYVDDCETDGPDRIDAQMAAAMPCIYRHNVHIEVYEAKRDAAAEAALEASIRARGLDYKKQGREWLSDVQRYLINYEISYAVKK